MIMFTEEISGNNTIDDLKRFGAQASHNEVPINAPLEIGRRSWTNRKIPEWKTETFPSNHAEIRTALHLKLKENYIVPEAISCQPMENPNPRQQ